MSAPKVRAIYRDTGVLSYKDNPFIEALPPLQESVDSASALRSTMRYQPEDLQKSRVVRAHNIARIINDFFQPLSAHMLLSERVSLMIRGGYVGRNPKTGDLQRHLQNGYERVQTGDLSTFRFEEAKSTAQSMLMIGCSGGGKTTSLERIFQTYPQVIYHPEFNLEQVVYLKVDCSHNGSLKEICLNFFRAMDKALGTNYEKKYGLKRNGIETMLALMAQIANTHALGLLVIDEIQHLSRSKSGGSEEMLNFFVTMVNTIGVPVMLIGTPKARDIFEADLRSARRGAGLGAIFWEPMAENNLGKPNQEWIAFTNNLWKLQLLQNRDILLADDIRAVWYDLSQGVMDIVVKLFVLAQLRALALNKERITIGLLKQVYEDELKPVHPMLDALRSGVPEKIAQYSDLMVPKMDKRLIQLQQAIATMKDQTQEDLALQQLAAENERRLYMLLKDVYDSSLLIATVRKAFSENPQMTMSQLLPVVTQWMTDPAANEATMQGTKKEKPKQIKTNTWDQLGFDDIRYIKSQHTNAANLHTELMAKGMLFDLKSMLA